MASLFKASFHPAGPKHPSAAWTFGFTRESKQQIAEAGSRRSHTWPQAPEFLPGWYRGPAISVPRLPDRPYDLPPTKAELGDMRGVEWVDAPEAGNGLFLLVFLTDDDHPDLPALDIGSGRALGALEMSNGWHLSVVADERPLREEELRPVYGIRDDMRVGVDSPPQAGSMMGAIVWVATSPDGPPIFMQIVLGSDNFQVR
jgi:hypothetical protein